MKALRSWWLPIVAALAAPVVFWAFSFPLAFALSFALKLTVPDLPGLGGWPAVLATSMAALVALRLIFRAGLQGAAGLSTKEQWQKPSLILLPAYLPLLMVIGPGFSFPTEPHLIFAAVVHCMLIGFSEEVIFRGFVQSAFIKWFSGKPKGVICAVLLSSASFGIMHMANSVTDIDVGPGFHLEFHSTAQSKADALSQVIYATFFGVFSGAVLLKSNKLWPLVLMHALMDFPFSLQKMMNDGQGGAGQRDETLTIDLGGPVLFLPLFFAGLLVLRSITPADIARKLGRDVEAAELPARADVDPG